MQIIVGLPFGDLSYGVRVFDKFTRTISSQEYCVLTQVYKFKFLWSKKYKIFVIVPLKCLLRGEATIL